MSVTGLCQICESATADEQCERCGTLVCTAHYDEQLHLCADCARQASPGDRSGEDRPDEFRI